MKISFSIYLVFVCLFSSAQSNIKENTVSIVSYEETPIPSPDAFKDVPKELQEVIIKNAKPRLKYYDLFFNDNEAFYKRVLKKIETPEDISIKNIQMTQTVLSFGEAIEMYENYKTKKSVALRTILDKEFLVSDDLRKINWELLNETLKIGNLDCKKAQVKIGDDIIEAWYAPSIPTMAGPGIYWGLPGLIVKLKSKTKHCIAIQIKENTKGVITIPTKGKEINSEAFKKLAAESLSEWTKDKPKFRVVNE